MLRAAEIDADVILLAKNIDGVYSADPKKDPTAKKYSKISYDEVLAQHLAVMDTTATSLSMDNHIPVLLFALKDQKLADLYLETFCEMSDTARQYVQRWLPITAASRLGKKLPGERALLESWLDVVEYE